MLEMLLKRERIAIIVLTIVVILGSVVRLHNITKETIGHSEIYTPGIELPSGLSSPEPRMNLKQTLVGMFVDQEPHPPGYYIFMLGWTKLFGTDIFMLRLPSLLFGIASIILLFLIGIIETEVWVALLAAAMLTFNGHQIYWSQISKMYMMGCFWGLLSTLFLLLSIKRKKLQRFLQLMYIIATLGGLTTVVFFWFVLFVQMFWIFLKALKVSNLVSILNLQFLIIILGSPLLAMAIFQGGRESYINPNFFPSLVQFLQFGYLFEADPLSLPPKSIPIIGGILISALAIFLLIIGLTTRKSKVGNESAEEIQAINLRWIMPIASIIASFIIIRLAMFTVGFNSIMTRWVFVFSIFPLLILIIYFLIQYNRLPFTWIKLHWKKVINFLQVFSLNDLLAVLPVIIIALISLVIPMFASRTIMLFTPFLLITLSKGIINLIQRNKFFVTLIFILAILFSSSIVYFQNVKLEHPTDYKGLAEQWIPEIRKSDLIFMQRHWVSTPIFYYLKADQYQFISNNYLAELQMHPDARIWVLEFTGLPMSDEIRNALSDFNAQTELEALRIKTTLYTKAEVNSP